MSENASLKASDIKRRLALSQARGWRQESLVNELLTGKVVPAAPKDSVYRPANRSWTEVGETRATYASFLRLRVRLVSVGFVIKGSVAEGFAMTFPEEAV